MDYLMDWMDGNGEKVKVKPQEEDSIRLFFIAGETFCQINLRKVFVKSCQYYYYYYYHTFNRLSLLLFFEDHSRD